eukprot:Rhum_TRINITY_DN2340_c0_g1::Rhum_TRINITY_DN2340_c0_g1_i1::g.6726::m.6726
MAVPAAGGMLRRQQRFKKMAYKYYEDQLQTSLPKAKAAKPTFINRQTTTWTTREKYNVPFRQEFYNTQSAGQAAQFIQGGSFPTPDAGRDENVTYDEFMSAGYAAAKQGSDVADRSPQRLQSKSQAELLAEAQAIQRRSKDMGRLVMDASTSESARNKIASVTEEDIRNRSPDFHVPEPEFVKYEEVAKVRDGLKGTPEPRFEEMPGKSHEEQKKAYGEAMRMWEETDRVARTPQAEYIKKRRQEGAPEVNEWSKDDEAAYHSSRKAFMDHYLSQPGWNKENFGAMYGATVKKSSTGLVSMSDLRGAGWQL